MSISFPLSSRMFLNVGFYLQTSICMTSVINRRSQFEKGVNELNTEIENLNKLVAEQEAEISRLNTKLDS